MKKTPIKKIGKVGKANTEARKIIAQICEDKCLDYCEIGLEGCLNTMYLAPAHRHPRAWYKGSVELLSDYSEWVVACVHCHQILDKRTEESNRLTEEVFSDLRPC